MTKCYLASPTVLSTWPNRKQLIDNECSLDYLNYLLVDPLPG